MEILNLSDKTKNNKTSLMLTVWITCDQVSLTQKNHEVDRVRNFLTYSLILSLWCCSIDYPPV